MVCINFSLDREKLNLKLNLVPYQQPDTSQLTKVNFSPKFNFKKIMNSVMHFPMVSVYFFFEALLRTNETLR